MECVGGARVRPPLAVHAYPHTNARRGLSPKPPPQTRTAAAIPARFQPPTGAKEPTAPARKPGVPANTRRPAAVIPFRFLPQIAANFRESAANFLQLPLITANFRFLRPDLELNV